MKYYGQQEHGDTGHLRPRMYQQGERGLPKDALQKAEQSVQIAQYQAFWKAEAALERKAEEANRHAQEEAERSQALAAEAKRQSQASMQATEENVAQPINSLLTLRLFSPLSIHPPLQQKTIYP